VRLNERGRWRSPRVKGHVGTAFDIKTRYRLLVLFDGNKRVACGDKGSRPTEAALLHDATGIMQASQWKSLPSSPATTLKPSGTLRNPLLNGLISNSSASPVLAHFGHLRCSVQLVIIAAIPGSISRQYDERQRAALVKTEHFQNHDS
jgi:hypothetical protein